MRVNDTLAVQLLQSRLRQMEMSRLYPQIPVQLFAQGEDVEVWLQPDVPARGFSAVNAYYYKLLERSDQAGGYLRGDLATTQTITVDPDGLHATGMWLTFGPHVDETTRLVTYCIGKYTSNCRVEHGVWRIAKLTWEPVVTTAPVALKPEENHGLSVTHQEQWPQPPQKLHELRTTGPESQRAVDILLIENAFGRFLQQCAAGQEMAAGEAFFAPDATWQWGDEAPRPAREVLAALQQEQADWICLGTTRVIEPTQSKAEATWGAFALGVEGQQAKPLWGRWYVQMEQSGGGWKCRAIRWITVAALEPWEITQVNCAACWKLKEGSEIDAG